MDSQPPSQPPPGYYPPQQNCPPRRGLHPAAIVAIVLGGGCVLIAMVGIIATVSIPVLLSSRNAAIDEQARNYLRTVVSSESAYFAAYGHYGDLPELVDASYLDQRFASNPTYLDRGIVVSLSLAADAQSYTAESIGPTMTYTASESGEIHSH